VCPVKIDIPRVLLHLRAEAVRAKPSRRERAAMRLVGWTFESARRFGLAQRAARIVQRPLLRAGLLSAWTRTRDLKPVPRESFREWWRRERA
jgi:L-lactate dehydrogenase complex protein LldF